VDLAFPHSAVPSRRCSTGRPLISAPSGSAALLLVQSSDPCMYMCPGASWGHGSGHAGRSCLSNMSAVFVLQRITGSHTIGQKLFDISEFAHTARKIVHPSGKGLRPWSAASEEKSCADLACSGCAYTYSFTSTADARYFMDNRGRSAGNAVLPRALPSASRSSGFANERVEEEISARGKRPLTSKRTTTGMAH
jgi:hypothetical protein